MHATTGLDFDEITIRTINVKLREAKVLHSQVFS